MSGAGADRVERALARAQPGDLAGARAALRALDAEVAVHERAVAAASTYALGLAGTVLLAALVVAGASVGAPAPGGAAAAHGLLGAAVVSLLVLAVAVRSGRGLPAARGARSLLDTLAFLGVVDALRRHGVRLALAARAAAAWLDGATGDAAERFAQGLEAGGTGGPAGPLPAGWSAFLTTSASVGADAEAVSALLDAHRAALPVALGGALARLEMVTVAVAGFGVLGVALGFYLPYLRAVLALAGS